MHADCDHSPYTARISSGGVAINYVLPVSWMASYFRTVGPMAHILCLLSDESVFNSRNYYINDFQSNFAQRQRSASTHHGLRMRTEGEVSYLRLPFTV